MQTLNFVTDLIRNSLNDFIEEKEKIRIRNNEIFINDGLSHFQLHIATELIVHQAFIKSREVEKEFNEWVLANINESTEISLNELEEFKSLKLEILSETVSIDTIDPSLDSFELALYSKAILYREFLEEIGFIGDFVEFVNELKIDLVNYGGEEIGLVEYLIKEEIIYDEEQENYNEEDIEE